MFVYSLQRRAGPSGPLPHMEPVEVVVELGERLPDLAGLVVVDAPRAIEAEALVF